MGLIIQTYPTNTNSINAKKSEYLQIIAIECILILNDIWSEHWIKSIAYWLGKQIIININISLICASESDYMIRKYLY